jgi:Tol biopolymer transport system component
MNRHRYVIAVLIVCFGLALSLAPASPRQARSEQEVQLQRAIQKENFDGDLKGAIEQYKKIIDARGTPRGVAARAMLQLGGCYEKLGNASIADARKTFEKLLNEFPDQSELANQARAHLATLPQTGKPATDRLTDQLIWKAPQGHTIQGVSKDGRHVLCGNGGTILWMHDLANGNDRELVNLAKNQGGVWRDPVISPDGKSVVYILALGGSQDEWGDRELWVVDVDSGKTRKLVGVDPQPRMGVMMFTVSPDGRQIAYEMDGDADAELRIVNIDGSQVRTLNSSRSLATEPGHYRVFVDAWSSDGTRITASGYRHNNDGDTWLKSWTTAVISVASDTARVLGKGFACDSFSPDGKYVVCMPPLRGNPLLYPLDGREPVPVFSGTGRVVPPISWMPDGRGMVLSSNHSGTMQLYAVRIINGAPQGEPVPLKKNMNFVPGMNASEKLLGLSDTGTYYYGSNATEINIYVADLNPDTGEVLSKPDRVNQTFVGSSYGPVAWSPNGEFLAFGKIQSGAPPKLIQIRSFPPGKGREITITPPLKKSNWAYLSWFPDGKSLLVDDAEDDLHRLFRKVDVDTGKQEPFLDRPGSSLSLWSAVLSPDGKLLYQSITKSGKGDYRLALTRRDLATGEERELYQTASSRDGVRSLVLSPDGRQLAFLVDDKDGTSLRSIPVEGGEGLELVRSRSQIPLCAWMRNSRRVLYLQPNAGSGTRLMAVASNGGAPIYTGLEMSQLGPLSVHPNGRRIAFVGGAYSAELWAITNILPNR